MLVVKNPHASAGGGRDVGLIPTSGRSPGGRHGNPLSIIAWQIPMDRGTWRALVHGVTKSQTRLTWLSTHTDRDIIGSDLISLGAFLVAQMVKNLPAMQETQVWSQGSGRTPGEENGYPLQYSCLKNPTDRPCGQKESDMTERLTLSLSFISLVWEKMQWY